jgi:hypothetical protein
MSTIRLTATETVSLGRIVSRAGRTRKCRVQGVDALSPATSKHAVSLTCSIPSGSPVE